MPDFFARVRKTGPIEIVQVTAVDRHVAIADLVAAMPEGESIEVMEVKEIPPVGPTGGTG